MYAFSYKYFYNSWFTAISFSQFRALTFLAVFPRSLDPTIPTILIIPVPFPCSNPVPELLRLFRDHHAVEVNQIRLQLQSLFLEMHEGVIYVPEMELFDAGYQAASGKLVWNAVVRHGVKVRSGTLCREEVHYGQEHGQKLGQKKSCILAGSNKKAPGKNPGRTKTYAALALFRIRFLGIIPFSNAWIMFAEWEHHSRLWTLLSVLSPFLWLISRAPDGLPRKTVAIILWIYVDRFQPLTDKVTIM